MTTLNVLSSEDISRCLIKKHNLVPPWPQVNSGNLRKAAVLIPFLRKDDAWHILFTRRTDHVQDHKGQVSFPGGAVKSEDKNETQAALREAYEEIGLHPKDVSVMGCMNEIATNSYYLITPVVGVIPSQYTFTPSPWEVSRIFTIPLTWLANPSHYQERSYSLPNGNSVPVIYFDHYDNELVWGITAYLTVNLIEILNDR